MQMFQGQGMFGDFYKELDTKIASLLKTIDLPVEVSIRAVQGVAQWLKTLEPHQLVEAADYFESICHDLDRAAFAKLGKAGLNDPRVLRTGKLLLDAAVAARLYAKCNAS